MSDDLEQRVNELEAKFEALNRARMYLIEENEELKEEVARLNEIVAPDPNHVEYEHLTRDQKVFRIRRRLVEIASSSNGAARMSYKDVTWLFDGHPSAGHVYDLMKLAGEMDGFEYQTDPYHRIVVNLGDVNDETLIHAANKASSEVDS